MRKNNDKKSSGSVKAVIGPMYAGKTGKIIQEVKNKVISESMKRGGKEADEDNIFSAYKPESDDRYVKDSLAAHDIELKGKNGGGGIENVSGEEIPATVLPVNEEGIVDERGIYLMSRDVEDKDPEMVAIDEAEFFSPDLYKTVEYFANVLNSDVVVGGLDTNFKGEPFETTAYLLAVAERGLDKKTARCEICGKEASRTQKKVDGKPASYEEKVIDVGGPEKYTSRCRKHHDVPGKPDYISKLEAKVKKMIDGSPEEYYRKFKEEFGE